MHPLTGQTQPSTKIVIVGKFLPRCRIGACDVVSVARKRHPAKRTLALAEQRSDVLGDESGNLERIAHARLLRLRPQIVAVVESDCSLALEREHGPNMPAGGRAGTPQIFLWI